MSSGATETEHDCIVIGSGPSGIAVAHALLARGRQVTLIDGGADLDAKARARKAAMAEKSPADWTPADIADWQAPQFSPRPGRTRRHGSDHAQLPAEDVLTKDATWFALRASHAIGGLSRVWGSAVLPNRQADMADWPITADTLAPHYRAVADFMPISGRTDDLQALLPAFDMSGCTPLPPGPQGRVLLARLNRAKHKLAARGVTAGQARQAVRAGCHRCGQCLHGCPYDMIFSADQCLADLRKTPGFRHLPGRIVARFTTDDGADAPMTLHLSDGGTLRAERIFLAAGVLETARLVLTSLPDRLDALSLAESQHFFLPLLHHWRPDGHPERDPHHTLTEAFIEIDDARVSPYLTHTQIYGWNEFFAREMVANYGAKLPGSAPLFRALARRLMVAQTFLHSDHGHTIILRLAADGMAERLAPEHIKNPETATRMAEAQKALSRALRHAGLHALGFAMRPGEPGSSFHTGATLPMRTTPNQPAETDALGRLDGLSRLHVIDASVLPNIPATTITFSVMANAHRIATDAAIL